MNSRLKETIWGQFGAAIDTMERAIRECPDDLWFKDLRFQSYWYIAHHTIFWIDYYLTEDFERFRPPEPFGLEELDPAGVMPEEPYGRDQLLSYLDHCRSKSRAVIREMSEESADKRIPFGEVELTRFELLLYIMRHVQHHSAQLNLLQRQNVDSAPGWIFRSRINLDGEPG